METIKINTDYLPTSRVINEKEEKNAKVFDVEIKLPDSIVKAYYILPTNKITNGNILYTHWLSTKPDANRIQFLKEANELGKQGFSSLLVDTLFANWPKAKKKWTGTDAQFDRELVVEQIQQLRYCLKWLMSQQN
ncbi:MAG: hypothetical protein HOO91_08530 [Bacteroidales bacterium]|nr:hypothetical protein [Bacteroidales bacterium]